MNDLEIMHANGKQCIDILHLPISIQEKEQKIRELLKDIDGEILIEKTFVGGFERISRIDVQPTSINLFQQFDCTQADATVIALSRLYLAYLLCQHCGDSNQLYKALMDYQRATRYPITNCSPDDGDWMMLEASVIIDSTLIQGEEYTDKANLLSKIKDYFPHVFG